MPPSFQQIYPQGRYASYAHTENRLLQNTVSHLSLMVKCLPRTQPQIQNSQVAPRAMLVLKHGLPRRMALFVAVFAAAKDSSADRAAEEHTGDRAVILHARSRLLVPIALVSVVDPLLVIIGRVNERMPLWRLSSRSAKLSRVAHAGSPEYHRLRARARRYLQAIHRAARPGDASADSALERQRRVGQALGVPPGLVFHRG